jgi:hypothetical protein
MRQFRCPYGAQEHFLSLAQERRHRYELLAFRLVIGPAMRYGMDGLNLCLFDWMRKSLKNLDELADLARKSLVM